MVNALDTKLIRDLGRLKGQVITIALVVACGIASYVTMRSAYDSLVYSRDSYYEHHHFADVFAHLERAPEEVKRRVELVGGVARVQTRVTEAVMVPMKDMPRPASGQVVSLPSHGTAELNRVYLTRGRYLDPTRGDEALAERRAQRHAA